MKIKKIRKNEAVMAAIFALVFLILGIVWGRLSKNPKTEYVRIPANESCVEWEQFNKRCPWCRDWLVIEINRGLEKSYGHGNKVDGYYYDYNAKIRKLVQELPK